MNNNEEIMLYIAKMYKEIKQEVAEGRRKKPNNYVIDSGVEFVEYIDRLLELLPPEYEKIIRNDYLNERNKKWWQEYFKKSTYYRRKSEAVKAFVDCVTLK